RYNDIWLAEVSSSNVKWTRQTPQQSPTEPPPTTGHACAMFGSRIYVFGGRVSETDIGEGGAKNSNEIWALETNSSTWRWIQVYRNSTQNVGGIVPTPRQNPQMVVVGTYMIVSGGSDGASDIIATDPRGQFYFFDLCSNQWVAPVTSLDPTKNKCDNGLGGGPVAGDSKSGGGVTGSGNGSLSTGAIIGIAVGAIVLLGALGLLALWIRSKPRKNEAEALGKALPATPVSETVSATPVPSYSVFQPVDVETTPPPPLSPSPTNSAIINTRTVIEAYLPMQNDEIALNVGDVVATSVIFSDGWAQGMNITTSQMGTFPVVCLEGMATFAPTAGPYVARSDSTR
ncbi:hypothetical protein HK102_007095, partial [Quaeritorhiza haematococci]